MSSSATERILELKAEVLKLQLQLQRREQEFGRQAELNRQLQATNARQELRIADLEMRVRRDSTTSSAPPSSDKPWNKEARRKERNKRKSTKKKDKGGAKKGHKGSRRARLVPAEVVPHEPVECIQCGEGLAHAPNAGRLCPSFRSAADRRVSA